MIPSSTALRFGYGTNGFTHHRLSDIFVILADLGYDGVALSLDHGHLDPYADDLHRRVDTIAQLLAWHKLDVTIETGSPYLLDPWGRHLPTLMEAREVAESRIDLLCRAVRIAAGLGAPVVRVSSGPAPSGVPEQDAWQRLLAGVETVLTTAEQLGISLAFQPEPRMFVDTVERCWELAEQIGGHELLGISVDISNAHCAENRSVMECLRLSAPRLLNVQIADARRGAEQRLALGAGEIDFLPVLAALHDANYQGMISVDVPGHSLGAPEVAHHSMEFLRDRSASLRASSHSLRGGSAATRAHPQPPESLNAIPPFLSALSAGLETPAHAWLNEAVTCIATDPASIGSFFSAVPHRCGQAHLNEHWTVDEAVRSLLVATLPFDGRELADAVTRLYGHGDARERRAVLRALSLLDTDGRGADGSALGDLALPLVREALNTNDRTTIEAAMGPYAAAHLPDGEYRQAVLACALHEIPLDRVTRLDDRLDQQLVSMLTAFARKRITAGREVPPDIWSVIRRFPDAEDELAAEVPSAVPARQEAAVRATASPAEDN